jgi:hypothetical protein
MRSPLSGRGRRTGADSIPLGAHIGANDGALPRLHPAHRLSRERPDRNRACTLNALAPEGLPTIHSLSKQHISNELLTKEVRHLRRVELFPGRHFPSQFVGEVHWENHVALGLLRFRCLDGH